MHTSTSTLDAPTDARASSTSVCQYWLNTRGSSCWPLCASHSAKDSVLLWCPLKRRWMPGRPAAAARQLKHTR
jgi:hypothetical protein